MTSDLINEIVCYRLLLNDFQRLSEIKDLKLVSGDSSFSFFGSVNAGKISQALSFFMRERKEII
jgi:hypothetical protein